MLDHDGQRPEALDRVIESLALVQVTLTGDEDDAIGGARNGDAASRGGETCGACARAHAGSETRVTGDF